MASGKTQNKKGAGNAFLRFTDPLNTMGLGRQKPSSNKKSFNPSQTPSFQNSASMYGDQLTGRTYKDPKLGIVSQYLPSQAEQQTRTAAQAGINNLIPSLGQTDPQMANEYDSMANAYADNEKAQFDRMYDPSLRNLREDIGSRFGTTQASPYYDQLNQLETNVRMPALLQIANDAAGMKQTLYNNAQNQKLAQLQGLGYVLNGNQQNFLNNLQNPQQSSNAGNAFNLSNYQNLLNQYQFNQGLQANQNNALLQLAGTAIGTAAKSAI